MQNASSISILDIGAGTGNIAIALAKNLPGSRVTAVEISREALDLAVYNAELNAITRQIQFVQGNILTPEFIHTLGSFDCVVSNPPYVSQQDRDKLQAEITRFEPAVAVFSGDDPLIFFKTIVGNISYILKAGGLLAFEVGKGQAPAVAVMMKNEFNHIEITSDLAGIERVVTGFYARPY
jgi:release factor glutamine methyltransferase